MSKLTIIVGHSTEYQEVDWSDMVDELLPKELVETFEDIHDSLSVIRVCTPTIINYIGCKIEEGLLNPEDYVIITEHGEHYYDEKGVLSKGAPWPYGIFNWS